MAQTSSGPAKAAPNSAPRHSVAELQAGARIDDQVFRVAAKDLRTTTNGSLYIHIVIADGSGQMLARLWSATQELYDSVPEGGLMHFRGRVENYKGNRQFIIDGMRVVTPGSFDPAEFLPHSPFDADGMWNELKELLRAVKNADLLALIGKFVNDARFVADFKRAPAAVQFHHAYIGGLLEHTRNLLRLARAVCPLYPDLSQDLVLTGIFFHDAGKVRELAYAQNLEYTDEGQLLGHITQAVLWVHEKCRELEQETKRPFPAAIETALKHIILAHHGKYEFGSPRLPALPEAIVVHYLDNLDAKVQMFAEAVRADNDATSHWTGYVKALETRVFKPDIMGERKA